MLYRGEYLDASILFEAEGKGEPALQALRDAVLAGELGTPVALSDQKCRDPRE